MLLQKILIFESLIKIINKYLNITVIIIVNPDFKQISKFLEFIRLHFRMYDSIYFLKIILIKYFTDDYSTIYLQYHQSSLSVSWQWPAALSRWMQLHFAIKKSPTCRYTIRMRSIGYDQTFYCVII